MIHLIQPHRTASLVALCQRAIAALDEGLQADPGRQAEPIAQAERAVSGLRDDLIERLRRHPAGEETSPERDNLNQVNVSLSLIAAVEFPAGAIQKKKLKNARKLLKKLEKSLPDLSEPEA